MTAEGARHVYEKMAELPFDSFRKCMTVIVKDAEGVSKAQHNGESIIHPIFKGKYLCVGNRVSARPPCKGPSGCVYSMHFSLES